MKAFLAKSLKGTLYVKAQDVTQLVEEEVARRRIIDRPAEPDETVLQILAAARTGDAADLARSFRKWVDTALQAWPRCHRTELLRAAELLQSIADEKSA